MPRRKLLRQNQFPYHVTTRTNHKAWFTLPMRDVWWMCKYSLRYAHKRYPVEIHCFVLMNNHYHLLVTTPEANIDKFMQAFNLKLSQLITWKSGIINHKFSNRYKWSIVTSQNYLHNVYRYIYQNPVRAKLSNKCVDYPYSSLRFTNSDLKNLNLKIHLEYNLNQEWFEYRVGEDFEMVMRNSLKKKYFNIAERTSTYHKNILENQNPNILKSL